MECKRAECIKEWREYVFDEEENARGYRKGGYTFTHCEMDGCHSIYPKGKNGYTCECCEAEVCEQCGDSGKFVDDAFFCSEECFSQMKPLY